MIFMSSYYFVFRVIVNDGLSFVPESISTMVADGKESHVVGYCVGLILQ